jgi:hypothetical protein
MNSGLSNQVLVLCDHDALYSAIELKLSSLPELHVTRLEQNPLAETVPLSAPADFDLIIVATLSTTADPVSLLAKLTRCGRQAEIPALIISERPSRPASEDQITFLNFPFDLDELTDTVTGILYKCPPNGA